MELGLKSLDDNLKNWADGWKNCDANLKSWVDDWKNYWNVGSDLNCLTRSGHCCFGSMRNLGDFSSQDCTLVIRMLGLEKAAFIGFENYC